MTTTQLSLFMNSAKPTVHAHAHVEQTLQVGRLLEGVRVVLQLLLQLLVEELHDGAPQPDLRVGCPSQSDHSEQVLQNHVAEVHSGLVEQGAAEPLGDCLQFLQHQTPAFHARAVGVLVALDRHEQAVDEPLHDVD